MFIFIFIQISQNLYVTQKWKHLVQFMNENSACKYQNENELKPIHVVNINTIGEL